MASGKSIGKSEGQKTGRLIQQSGHDGTPIQGRIQRIAPKGR